MPEDRAEKSGARREELEHRRGVDAKHASVEGKENWKLEAHDFKKIMGNGTQKSIQVGCARSGLPRLGVHLSRPHVRVGVRPQRD